MAALQVIEWSVCRYQHSKVSLRCQFSNNFPNLHAVPSQMERAHQENDAMPLEVLAHKHVAKQMEITTLLYILRQSWVFDSLKMKWINWDSWIFESNNDAHYQTIEVALDSRVKRMWIIVLHTRHRCRWIANEWENPWEAFHRQGRVAVKRSELEVNVVLLVVDRFGSIDPAPELWLHIKCYTHNFLDSNLDRAVAEDICEYINWKNILNYKKKIKMRNFIGIILLV